VNKFFFNAFFLLSVSTVVFAQEEIVVTGNEMIGRVENGVTTREVNGNVVLKQGNVTITCNKAIQYIATNNAHLIGNVIVTQDSLTIKTPEGFYYGNERRAFSDKGVTLDDRKVVLAAQIGEYLFKENKADFRRNVKLTDKTTILTSDRLLYFRKENKAVAVSNVKITDPENIMYADSLVHMRASKITYCFKNVMIKSIKDGVTIFGDHLVDYRLEHHSIIDENPLLVQLDTTFNQKRDSVISIDTLIIRGRAMEAYRADSSRFIVRDSVQIIRSGFASASDQAIYYDKEEKIYTYRLSDTLPQPAMWYQLTQMTGDSMQIRLKERAIQQVDIVKSAMIISQNEFFPLRYDQASGEKLILYFKDKALAQTDILGNVLSYYYMYDDKEPGGLIKASARDAKLMINASRVQEVHLYGEPKSEYHPENLVRGSERKYVLPQFMINEHKPQKQKIFSQYRNSRFTF
jgi:lipopolysaccharide export system protein LptA